MRHWRTCGFACKLLVREAVVSDTSGVGVFCVCASGTAATENRKGLLGQYYDEVCRREWSERAARGDGDFDVNIESCKLCKDSLDRARVAYDAAAQQQKKQSPASSASQPAKYPNKHGQVKKHWTKKSHKNRGWKKSW